MLMSRFWHKADIASALHMSAFDPYLPSGGVPCCSSEDGVSPLSKHALGPVRCFIQRLGHLAAMPDEMHQRGRRQRHAGPAQHRKSRNRVVKRSRLAAAVIVVALLGYSTAAEVGAETKKDPSFVWPRNSQFNCRGILIQDEGTYQLKPDEGMLTWCDAEIAGGDKGRVLDACTVGDSCEIKGIIRGHGAFGWVKITSVRSLKQEKSGAVPQQALSRLYTPQVDSPERAAIMDAIRLATNWTIKFKVNHLFIARQGNKAIAVTDVSDASQRLDNSGIFLLENLNSQWRPLYSVGGAGGSSDCKIEASIAEKMAEKAREYSAPNSLFPDFYWKIVRENKSEDDCVGASTEEFVRK